MYYMVVKFEIMSSYMGMGQDSEWISTHRFIQWLAKHPRWPKSEFACSPVQYCLKLDLLANSPFLWHSVCALSLVASHCSIHPCFWVYCCTIVWLPFICNQLYYNSFTIIVLDITDKQSRLLSICRVLPKCHLRLSIMGSKQYQQWHTKAGSPARNIPKTLYWKMSKSKLRRSHTS